MESADSANRSDENSVENSKEGVGVPAGRIPGWFRILPFFMSAVLFLSVFFTVLAPLPLLVFRIVRGFRDFAIALLVNWVLVGLVADWTSAVLFAIGVGTMVWVAPYLLIRRKLPLDRVVAYTMLVMVGMVAGAAVGYFLLSGVNPLAEVEKQITFAVEQVVQISGDVLTEADISAQELKQMMLSKLPSVMAIAALLFTWLNLMLLLRLNPGQMRRKISFSMAYLKNWKAPELLVWPTIAAGALMLFAKGHVSLVAMNLFEFLMAIYLLQGLSVVAFFCDHWSIYGLFRSLVYTVLVFLVRPLLLGIGFFDLWFDFRKKLKTTL